MIINLTPHAINEVQTGKTFQPSGDIARCTVSMEEVGEVEGVKTFKAIYGDIKGLPAQKDGVFYLVSGMVLSASDRKDLLAPGDLVRDENGKPIGCNGFKVNGGN